MSLEYIQKHYDTRAVKGAKILCCGLDAKIVGAKNQYLRVKLVATSKIVTVHPTWEIEYNDPTQDDIVIYTAKCIGCSEEFENFRFKKEDEDLLPVCGKCAETMRP